MTTRLTQALLDAAEQAPPVPPADELWRRGRRRRRRRRTAAALACLFLVAALAWSPPLRPGIALEPGEAGPAVLPATVAEPHLWQRTVDGDANGPVKLAFTTGHSLNLESALVLIGHDDSYRLDYLSPGEEAGNLSPDGRWLLGQNLRDLVTGDTRDLDRPLTGIVPAVWAPDSRTAVGVIMPDGGGTSYGPDGEPLDGPDDEIVLVDVASGSVRTIATVPEANRWHAAFSPDGRRLAIHAPGVGRDSALTVMDVQAASTLRTVTLTESQRLAGPAAWTPDGAQILLTTTDGCVWDIPCTNRTWHVQRVDVNTGTISDETARGRPGDPTLVAWRDGEPVVRQHRDDGSCETLALTATGARALPLAVAGHGCADYARDLLQDGALGGPGIEPSPWQAQWWVYALAAAVLAALTLIVWRIRRRPPPRTYAPTEEDE